MEDIRNRRIDCIICKDLSRFAREHIDAEDYLNNIFPFLGIRFIAVADGYDNLNIEPEEHFIASFKNYANAYFAQETSQKVSTAKRTLMRQGKYIGGRPLFGYKKDPADCHKLLIDEEKSPFVREIFERVCTGEKIAEICKDLYGRGVFRSKHESGDVSRIYSIVKNEMYTGTLIQHRTEIALYKNAANRKVPDTERIRVENAFPAIVSLEMFEKANEVVRKRCKVCVCKSQGKKEVKT
jgi:hypothetical protein